MSVIPDDPEPLVRVLSAVEAGEITASPTTRAYLRGASSAFGAAAGGRTGDPGVASEAAAMLRRAITALIAEDAASETLARELEAVARVLDRPAGH